MLKKALLDTLKFLENVNDLNFHPAMISDHLAF